MRLLVTRPQPGAGQTAARLAALGHAPVVLPLSRIVPVPPPEIGADETFDCVGASSVNALRHAPQALLGRLAELPCHVVGRATAAAAEAAGFRVGHVAPGAAALCSWLASAVAPGTRIAYLCGKVRLDLFEQGCRAAGIDARMIETYDTEAIVYGAGELAARLDGAPFDGVLLYSRMAARGMRALLARHEVAERFGGARYFCLSEGIAEALGPAGDGASVVAAEPYEAELLERIGPAK